MKRTLRSISIIIPAHNESANVAWFLESIQKVTKKITDYRFDYIFVDDGSTDDTLAVLRKLSEQNDDCRFISFSRNFGKEAATSAGLAETTADAAIFMDADGQHPAELLPKFIKKWEAGSEVVIGMRQSNTNEGFVKKYGSKLFYLLLSTFIGPDTNSGATDFRLIDRKVIDEFLRLTEHNRMTRGLIDWLGFERTYIPFSAPERHSGVATYNYVKLLRLALHGFVSQTTKPLQIAGVLGFVVTTVSIIATVFILINDLFGDPLNLAITGTAVLTLILSFLVGLVLICQWLLALYIESIHTETQNRPLYIISTRSK